MDYRGKTPPSHFFVPCGSSAHPTKNRPADNSGAVMSLATLARFADLAPLCQEAPRNLNASLKSIDLRRPRSIQRSFHDCLVSQGDVPNDAKLVSRICDPAGIKLKRN